MAELVDALDLGSSGQHPWGFESPSSQYGYVFIMRVVLVPVFLAALLVGTACGDDDDGGGGQPDAALLPDAALAVCGNHLLEPGEECDDGNRLGGDGCSATCRDEAQCLDGVREGSEECDGQQGLPTCVQLGYVAGFVDCTTSCELDISDCNNDDSTGLVAWYKLDDTTASGIAADSSGSGNGCSIQGAEPGSPGVIGDAFYFDGASAYLDCGQGLGMDALERFTVEAWIKLNAFSPEGMIVSRASSLDASGLVFYLGVVGGASWGSNQYHAVFGGRQLDLAAFSTELITTGTWHHLAGAYSSGHLTIFVDGVESGSADQLGPAVIQSPPGTKTYVGHLHDESGSGLWDTRLFGYIDDVKIWLGARSQSTICMDAGGMPDPEVGCVFPE